MVGEYEGINQHMSAGHNKLEKEFEENFDDMVIDEGVNASKIHWEQPKVSTALLRL